MMDSSHLIGERMHSFCSWAPVPIAMHEIQYASFGPIGIRSPFVHSCKDRHPTAADIIQDNWLLEGQRGIRRVSEEPLRPVVSVIVSHRSLDMPSSSHLRGCDHPSCRRLYGPPVLCSQCLQIGSLAVSLSCPGDPRRRRWRTSARARRWVVRTTSASGGELRRRWESAPEIMMLERDGLQELSELWCSRGDPPRPRPHLGHDPTSASVAPRPRLHLGLLGPISASSPPRPRLHLGLAPTSASAPPRPRSLLGLGPTSASATPRPRPHLGLGSTSASAAPRPRLHLVPDISRYFQICSDIFRYSDISDISRYFQIF